MSSVNHFCKELNVINKGRNSIKLRFSRIKETKKRQANGRQAISVD
jgi:hypothetical protein